MNDMLWRLKRLKRIADTLTKLMTDDYDADDDDPRTDFTPNATFTRPDGTTTTTTDFHVDSLTVNADRDMQAMAEVSAGLSPVVEDTIQDFQLSIEVPVRVIECPNCRHLNDIPIWSFVELSFGGDLQPLSGEYALGIYCVQCGFPY